MTYYDVPSEEIVCGVFTTDQRIMWRAEKNQILEKYITIPKLREWVIT